MTLNEYLNAIKQFVVVPEENMEAYLVSLLASEAGECFGLWGKQLRGDFDHNNAEQCSEYLKKMVLELGDTFWALVLLVDYYGFSIETVMEKNVEKLRSRQAANTIRSNNGEKRND